MKRKHTLRSLLSMVCTIAMIVSMVPVLPAAAAADVLYDTMESYTVGTDLYTQAADKYTKTSPAWGHATYAGSSQGSVAVATDPTNSGNKVLAVTANGDTKRFVLSTVPTVTGDYTLQFDYMPAKLGSNSGSGFLELYVNGGKTVMARTFFYKNSNQIKFMTNGSNLGNTVKPAEPKDNTWYSVRVVISSEEYIMEVWEKGNKEATLITASTTSGTVENTGTNVEFCFGPYNASQVVDTSGPITNYIDNIRITPGVVEDTSSGSPADDGSISVSGGGMVSFTDADQIVNAEAVSVTAGMGLFAGKDGGRFDPAGVLTRAEMATIIVKMLRGNAFNADNFKGYDKFSDTADYQGGWAEGYINACVQMGVVSGYGDGTFKPGNPVNTAEALTMIINALKVDTDEGEAWPTPYMTKALEMKLYGDLATKPGTYDSLTRDQLAVLVYEGMCYSPSGVSGWKVPGTDMIFTEYADAMKVCTSISQITEVMGEDSLASKIYEMKTFEGFITANQDTGDNGYTTVTAYSANGTGLPASKNFNMNTVLGEIGHYVTVYYREEHTSEVKPGVVYNYVDETEVITVDEAITTSSKKYKEVFTQSIKEATLANGSDDVLQFTPYYTTSVTDNTTRGSIPGYTAGTDAQTGIYLINDGVIKAYMPLPTVYADKVTGINDFEGQESIELSGILLPLSNSEDKDLVVEYNKIKKDDYVTYVTVGGPKDGANTIYVLTKAKTVKGTVSKIATNKNSEKVVVVKGTEYVSFGTSYNDTGLKINTTDLNTTDSFTFYITEDGKYIGFEMTTGGFDMNKTVFILGQNQVTSKDSYGKTVRKTFARGIDMSGKEVNILLAVEKNGTMVEGLGFTNDPADDICDPVYATALKRGETLVESNTFYSYELSTDGDAKKQDLYVLTPYAATYDPDEDNTYTHSRSIKAGDNYAMYDFSDSHGKKTLNGSGPVLLLEGSVDQTTPLSATISKTYGNQVNTGSTAMSLFHLINRDDSDHAVVRASVLLTDDLAKATAGEVVYVSAQNAAPAGSTVDGLAFDVYDYKTGAARQITIKANDPLLVGGAFASAGYWHVAPDVDSNCYVIRAKVKDSAATTSASKTNENTEANDQLYTENIYHGQLFVDLLNDKLTTTSMFQASKASDGVVVDTRSEDEITASGLGKISSVDRIASLALDHPEIVVTFDLCYSTGSDKMLTIFVTDVHYTTVGSGSEITKSGTTYYLDGLAVVDPSSLIFVDGTGAVSGATTADKMDALVTMAQTQNVAVNYTVANGKVTSITVDCILPALAQGVLFHDEFSYTVGNLPMRLWQKQSNSGSGTAEVVSGGKVKLAASSASSGSDIRVQTMDAFDGDYEVEVNFTAETASRRLLITLSGVSVPNSDGWKALDVRVNADNIAVCTNLPSEMRNSGDNDTYAYVKTSGAEQYTAAAGTAHTMKINVSKTNGTVTITLFKGADVMCTRTLPCIVSTGAMGLEEHVANSSVQVDEVKITRIQGAARYDINAAPNNYLYGKVSTNAYSAAAGDTITITATPATGYKATGITVKDEAGADITSTVNVQTADGKYTFDMPAKAVSVVANFVSLKYSKVTINNPAEGTITVTGADDLTNVLEGTELTITAAATDPTRYALKAIKVNGADVAEVDGAYTYTVPTTGAELVVTAVFDTVYTIATPTVANGTVTVDKAEGAVAGAIVTITATPAQYYKVKSISVKDSQNGTVTVTDNKFTMPADDVTVTAEFEPITYTLTTGVNNASFGEITAGGTKNAGEDVVITAAPATGYVAKYILVNGTKAAEGGSYTLNVADDTDTTVTAVFWPEGAYLYDDFGTYTDGKFDKTMNGYSVASSANKEIDVPATVSVADDGGDEYLKIGTGAANARIKLSPNQAPGTASWQLSFKMMLNSSYPTTNKGFFDLYLGTFGSSDTKLILRVRDRKTSAVFSLVGLNSDKQRYLRADGTYIDDTSGGPLTSSVEQSDITAAGFHVVRSGAWYDVSVSFDATTSKFTVTAKNSSGTVVAAYTTDALSDVAFELNGVSQYPHFDLNAHADAAGWFGLDEIVYKPLSN